MTFFGLAFALSWLLWVPLIFLPVPDGVRGALLVAGTFGPSTAALILLTRRAGWAETRIELATKARWRLRWYLWLIAFLGPAAIILTALAISALVGQPADGWQDPTRLYLIIPVFAYVLVFGGPLGEEIGWRGYAVPRWQRRHSPTVVALVIGVAWALWHAPLFAIEGTVQQSVPVTAFVVQIITTSVVYVWLWNRTESILLIVVFHAAFNTSVGLFPILPDTAGTTTPLRVALVLAVVIAAALIGATRGRLGYNTLGWSRSVGEEVPTTAQGARE